MSYLRHSLLVASESNQSILFLYLVFSKWSVSSRKNLFLMFEFVEDRDDDFDVVDIDNGDVVDPRTSFFLTLQILTTRKTTSILQTSMMEMTSKTIHR